VGEIKLKTDGKTGYAIIGSNRVHGGTAKPMPPDNVWHFELTEHATLNDRALQEAQTHEGLTPYVIHQTGEKEDL
jgi:hypothetical protein